MSQHITLPNEVSTETAIAALKLLKEAHKLIAEPDRWTKKAYFRDKEYDKMSLRAAEIEFERHADYSPACMCSMGALRWASGFFDTCYAPDASPLAIAIWVLDSRVAPGLPLSKPSYSLDSGQPTIGHNDAPHIGHSDVMEWWNQAEIALEAAILERSLTARELIQMERMLNEQ